MSAVRHTKARLPHEKPLAQAHIDIMRMICQGMSAKEVARHRDVSPRTVEHQIREVRLRLQARNVVHAAVLFERGDILK